MSRLSIASTSLIWDIPLICKAELEAKLAAQTPTSDSSRNDSGYYSSDPNPLPMPIPSTSSSLEDYQLPGFNSTPYGSNQSQTLQSSVPQLPGSAESYNARLEEVPDITWTGTAPSIPGSMQLDWDLGGLFVVPAKWPRNLPPPCTSLRHSFSLLMLLADDQSSSNICMLP